MKTILTSFLMVFSCVLSIADDITVNDARNWLNYEPDDYMFDRSRGLIEYTEISDTILPKYVMLLSEKSFQNVDVDTYKSITGLLPTKAYLIAVRAVYSIRGGVFYVRQHENSDISISYGVLGGRGIPHKTVLFMETDNLPNNVFVTCVGAM